MFEITGEEILNFTGGELIDGNTEVSVRKIVIDSRKACEGSLFVPIKGETNDGHDYIEKAFENGAAAVITERALKFKTDRCVIKVKDTRKALGDIAKFYKQKHNIPTVSVTGSVGKTTTKDMIYAALSTQKSTLKTQKNFNNDLGVPLTVFDIDKGHELAIIEMGMNHFGELEYLASIVKPDIAVITNIGQSHIENLGSREGIFKAKMEITTGFCDKNTLIVNGDDEFLKKIPQMPYKTIRYGINTENDVYAKNIVSHGLDGVDFTADVYGNEYEIKLKIPGTHNVYNALAALCAAKEFGLDIKKAVEGLENVCLTENRFETENIGGATVIKDYYNASPDSVKAALKIISETEAKRKIAILGDILEMGKFADAAHYEIGEIASKSGIDLLITAGKNAKRIADGAKGVKKILSFDTTDEAAKAAKANAAAGDLVLIKASHGMKFEKIYDALKN